MNQFLNNTEQQARRIFEEPKLQRICFDTKDILTLSPNDPTDATDPNQGIWVP